MKIRNGVGPSLGLLPFAPFACAALASLTSACEANPKPLTIEDEARKLAPPPACIMRLPTRPATGLMRNLKEDQYWKLVFPAFDEEKRTLPENPVTCTGRTIFDTEAFRSAKRMETPPQAVVEGEILFGSGGDRLRVIWMRTHVGPDGHEIGPLAIVRTKSEFAEVYAIGAYKGRTKRPLFNIERMGYETAVTVTDEHCIEKDRKPNTPCESTLALYLPRRGNLINLATFATDQRDYVVSGEPGTWGRIEYRLAAGTKYTETGLVVSEEIVAVDEGGRELRRAELDRVFTLAGDRLAPSEGPLWPRIFPGRKVPGEPAAAPSAAAPKGAKAP
jgi:hypothetical protein